MIERHTSPSKRHVTVTLKILHISNYFLPWLGYDAELARVQRNEGHNLLFAASNRIPGSKSSAGSRPESPIDVVNSTLHRPVTIGSRVVLLPGLLMTLIRFRPSVVHCHMILDLTPVIVALVKPFLRYRLIYCCHSTYENTNTDSTWIRKTLYTVFRQTAGRIIIAAADHILAVAEDERIMAARELSLPLEQVKIVRLGVDIESYRTSDSPVSAERKRLGIHQNEIVLVHVGGLEPRKNLHNLLEAVGRNLVKYDSLLVILVGGGESSYINSLQETAKRLGIEDRTRIIDHFVSKDEVRRYLAAADVGVWPGLFSIATLEALASGIPIIVRDKDDYTKVLTSNDNGYMIPSRDIEALTQCIADLAANPQLRKEMGNRSRELAMAEFNWASISRKLIDHYYKSTSKLTT